MNFSYDDNSYEIIRERFQTRQTENISEQMQTILNYIKQYIQRIKKMAEQKNKYRKKKLRFCFLSGENITTIKLSAKFDNKILDF